MNLERFDSIKDAIKDLQAGKVILLADDKNRENEGDLVCAAEKVTPEIINFMAAKARGLICLALENEQIERLGLPMMTAENNSQFSTNFTVSIEAAQGVTTGISAADRAHTIKTAIRLDAKPTDVVVPGHIFPLKTKNGGVLCRAGQTEGSADLAKLAGLNPSAVLCEVLNEDGSMARYPDLRKFADQHELKLVNIADLIEYRLQHEMMVEQVATANLPSKLGNFKIVGFKNKLTAENYVALVKGTWKKDEPVLVRVHSQCLTGEVFGSLRCDCQAQLETSMQMVEQEQQGIILYLAQEGRGIGILNKIQAYKLQDEGADTVEANHRLGFKTDLREYGFGAQVLVLLGLKKLRLITNNPRKIVGLEGYGLEVVERVPINIKANAVNQKYLNTKKERLGHLLTNTK